MSLIGGARATPIKLNWLISQPDRADGRRPSELQLAVRPIGELTSVAVLLREPPGFNEKPRFSRRLVKRLVRFYVKIYPYFLSQRTIFKCNSNMDGALKVCSFGGIVPTKGIIPSNFTTISIGFFPESLILMMEI